MSYETLLYELDAGVLTITLNRPDKFNAYTATMGLEIEDAFRRADLDDDVRVIIVTGAGRGFCGGADISAGADAFITGEISEPQAHYARECGVAYLACGHHASERFGAPAVAAHVAAQLGLAHEFIDIDNPA